MGELYGRSGGGDAARRANAGFVTGLRVRAVGGIGPEAAGRGGHSPGLGASPPGSSSPSQPSWSAGSPLVRGLVVGVHPPRPARGHPAPGARRRTVVPNAANAVGNPRRGAPPGAGRPNSNSSVSICSSEVPAGAALAALAPRRTPGPRPAPTRWRRAGRRCTPRCRRPRPSRCPASARPPSGPAQVDAGGGQGPGGPALALEHQTEQQVGHADGGVSEAHGLGLGQQQHPGGRHGESAEHDAVDRAFQHVVGPGPARRGTGGGAPPASCMRRAGRRHQRRRARRPAGQHLVHLAAHGGQVGPQGHQHLRRHPLALAHQAQQDVLGADVVVAELQRLAQRWGPSTFFARGVNGMCADGWASLPLSPMISSTFRRTLPRAGRPAPPGTWPRPRRPRGPGPAGCARCRCSCG